MAADESERQIRSIIDDWLAKVGSRDHDGIAALYAADGTLMLPNAEALVGRTAIADAWRELFTLPDLVLRFGPTRIDVAQAADMAMDVGTYVLEFDREGRRLTDRGKYLVVWRRTAEGWRVAADIINTDLPADAPVQASAAIP